MPRNTRAKSAKKASKKPVKQIAKPKKPVTAAVTENGAPNGVVVTLRDRLGLTQQEFATLLGLSTVSVSRWEHKHTKPTDASKALLDLLSRAVAKKNPGAIVAALRSLSGADEIDRIITLVHLGD